MNRVSSLCPLAKWIPVPKASWSRWFIVDPWPHNTMVTPFVDSYFDPKGVTHFTITTVGDKCEHPYGVDLDTDFDWNEIVDEAKKTTLIKGFDLQGVYGHSNPCKRGIEFRLDPRMMGPSSWGRRG